ncbi:MAG: DNA-3-methyladenine glycosylase [Myxococcota bacterium]
MPLGKPLPQAFFARDSVIVAQELIGCRFVHRLEDGERLVVRIVEVEAYRGDGSDAASHAHGGETPRNQTMFGPAGRLYVYRSYGIHTCVNVVCATPGYAAAVLLRGAEPLEGQGRMRALRGLAADAKEPALTRGPGRLGQAMGLRLDQDGVSLLRPPLTLHAPPSGEPAARVESGPRVGITKAAALPYRFFEADSPFVSPFRAGKSGKAGRASKAGKPGSRA